MVEHLLSGRAGAGVAGDLAAEFRRGYPVDRLFKLLDSEDPQVAIAGAFIATEIGPLAEPIADRLCSYLSHPEPWVRSDLLDAIMLQRAALQPPCAERDSIADDRFNQWIRRKAVAFMATDVARPAGSQQETE